MSAYHRLRQRLEGSIDQLDALLSKPHTAATRMALVLLRDGLQKSLDLAIEWRGNEIKPRH
jgi:hypothetical protein